LSTSYMSKSTHYISLGGSLEAVVTYCCCAHLSIVTNGLNVLGESRRSAGGQM
jgi:hypothetical protein